MKMQVKYYYTTYIIPKNVTGIRELGAEVRLSSSNQKLEKYRPPVNTYAHQLDWPALINSSAQ